ncbi:CCA tRNA nucleotidyltransferase, partial [Gemmiger formicilis]|nr:CCA tRNA nucleotidyltransferase [Gemmiger formicilis]
FTINAMAYAPGEGVIDLYGGRKDLDAGIIRCVGEPSARFAEDALRILRALRFAARLEFTLDEQTAAAALSARDTLQSVSAERIYVELDGLLSVPGAGHVLAQYGQILAGAVP